MKLTVRYMQSILKVVLATGASGARRPKDAAEISDTKLQLC